MNEGRHKRPHIILVQLNEVPRGGEPVGQIRLVVAKKESDYEHGVSFGVMKIF